jgi:HEAT repeat protein
MAKYRDIIDQLHGDTRRAARKLLVDADGRVLPALAHALRKHPNEDVRHEIAEILGERRHWKAVPVLIEALADECLFVRQDAAWSIEVICRLQPDALTDLLDLAPDRSNAKERVSQWWELNRQFIQGNPNLGC